MSSYTYTIIIRHLQGGNKFREVLDSVPIGSVLGGVIQSKSEGQGDDKNYIRAGAWGVLPVVETSEPVLSKAWKMSNTVTNPITLPD